MTAELILGAVIKK